jgi:hypothetical protein
LIGLFVGNLIFGSAFYRTSGGYDVDLSLQAVEQNANFFKVRFVPFLVPLITVLAYYLANRSLKRASMLLMASGLAFMILDARSSGLALLVSALVIYFLARDRHLHSRLAIYSFLLIAASYVAYVGYITYVTSTGKAGNTATQLARVENPYNPFELLLQGRSEWSVAATVISDAPLLGHGSWAEDKTRKYARLRAEHTDSLERVRNSSGQKVYLVPTHSVLLTGWIWGGLIGFAGTSMLVVSVVRAGHRCLRNVSPAQVIAIVFSVSIVCIYHRICSASR